MHAPSVTLICSIPHANPRITLLLVQTTAVSLSCLPPAQAGRRGPSPVRQQRRCLAEVDVVCWRCCPFAAAAAAVMLHAHQAACLPRSTSITVRGCIHGTMGMLGANCLSTPGDAGRYHTCVSGAGACGLCQAGSQAGSQAWVITALPTGTRDAISSRPQLVRACPTPPCLQPPCSLPPRSRALNALTALPPASTRNLMALAYDFTDGHRQIDYINVCLVVNYRAVTDGGGCVRWCDDVCMMSVCQGWGRACTGLSLRGRGPDSLPGERQGESECRRAREQDSVSHAGSGGHGKRLPAGGCL